MKIQWIRFVLALIVVGAIISIGVASKHASRDGDLAVSPSAPEIAEQRCFIWNTEAGDRMLLSVDIRGSNAIGELHFLPAEKDSKTGIFRGTIAPAADGAGRMITAWWKTAGEGQASTEELRIKLDGSIAVPGFGEMKDRGDGTFVYAHPNAINYAPPLQETDCGDAAMD